MQYKFQLQTAKKDGLPMRAYLNKIKNYCDLLGSARCRILQEDHIMHILSGLGTEYHPVIVAITSRAEPCSLQEASSILTSIETMLEGGSTSSINNDGSLPSVNLARSIGQRKESSYREEGNRSFNHRGDGGRSYNFRGRGGRGTRGGRSAGGPKLICQLCQKLCHVAGKCWHRFEQDFVLPTAPQARPAQSTHGRNYQHPPSAHIVQTRPQHNYHPAHPPSEFNVDNSTTSWYPDSGATKHISNDFSNLNVQWR